MKAATEHPYVVTVKGVCGGEPVIKGTRIPIRLIAECWRGGMSPEEIREAYPNLNLAQVFAALSYAEDHAEQIDSLLKEHRATYNAGLAKETKRGSVKKA